MIMLTKEQLADLLREAYQEGWDASGEGYNSEYPTLRADSLRRWEESRDADLYALLERAISKRDDQVMKDHGREVN